MHVKFLGLSAVKDETPSSAEQLYIQVVADRDNAVRLAAYCESMRQDLGDVLNSVIELSKAQASSLGEQASALGEQASALGTSTSTNNDLVKEILKLTDKLRETESILNHTLINLKARSTIASKRGSKITQHHKRIRDLSKRFRVTAGMSLGMLTFMVLDNFIKIAHAILLSSVCAAMIAVLVVILMNRNSWLIRYLFKGRNFIWKRS